MKKILKYYSKSLLICLFVCSTFNTFAQSQNVTSKSDFWKNVQFGGGLALNFGSGFTNIGVSPSAIYNVNQYFSLGTGLQVSYVESRNFYKSMIYGGSFMVLANPIDEIQLSVELEQLNVIRKFDSNLFPKENYWNTGFWLGAGYRSNNLTVGARYNVLFDKNKSVYSDALMPFVRVFF